MASSPFSESGRGGRPSLPRQPLGTVIFQKGLLSAEQLLEALEEGHRSRRRLGDVLLERGWLDERALAETLAEQHGLPVADLDPDDVDPTAARQISAYDSQRLGAIVIGVEDGAPVVALSDPSDAAALAELERMLPGALFAVAAPSRVAEALRSVFSPDGERGEFLSSAEAAVTERSAAPDEFVADEHAEPEPTAPVAAPAPESPDAREVFEEPQEADAAADALGSAFAATAESVPSERGAHDPPAWPAAVAAHDSAAVPEDSGNGFDEPLESKGADELSSAFAAPAEPVPSEPGAHDAPAWPAAVATHDSAAASEDGSDVLAEPLESKGADEVADDLSSAFASPAEPLPSEPGAHDPLAWPAHVATHDHVAMPEEDEDAVAEPHPAHEAHEAQEVEEAADDLSWAFAAPAESVPAELGSYGSSTWPATSATRDDVVAPQDAQLNGHAGDAAAASLVVLRLADGSAVELASFADRASASSRAVELIEQLIADESTGWTEIEGSYFRLQAIISVDVVPAAD